MLTLRAGRRSTGHDWELDGMTETLSRDRLAARVKALEDRIAIQEFLLAYFGYGRTAAHGSYDDFFAEDCHFDINGVICTSKAELPALYKKVGSYMPKLVGKFHMQLTNFLIRVDGDTATAQFLWTQQLNDTIKGPPRFIEQGREFDRLIRVNGQWKFKKRVLISDSGLLDCFDETWQQRNDYSLENDTAN
jgi:hypothetical protein